jgi:hypothetical protein
MELWLLRDAMRDKRFWAAVLILVAVLTGAIFWGVRAHQRSQARDELNAFTPFQEPAPDLSFPSVVIDTAEARRILEPGVRAGIWSLRERGGAPPALVVTLTNKGQYWFSGVGRQIVATFKVGTREATRVLQLKGVYPNREIRFEYVWKQFHTASAIFGSKLPELGTRYEGDAMMLYENDAWRVLQWTTPVIDEAVGQFRSLQAAPP